MVLVLFSEIDERSHRRLFSAHLGKFHAKEQEKLLRYRRWQDAQLSLLGKLLVMKGAEAMGVPYTGNELLQYNQYGKPAWKQNPFFFNISHSGGIAVCAVTKSMEVGIDIEIKHQVTVSDFRSQMLSTEWERVVSADNEMAAFYKYWTEKEAVIKAYGFGLSIPLQSFEIVNSCTNVNGRPFYLREIGVHHDYVCHIATGEKLAAEQIILERGYY
jgi:4'-phosphopantetheinyl transferase